MTRWQVFMGISPGKLTGHSPWEFLCEVAGELSVRLKQAPENNKPLLDVELTMKGAAKSSGVRHVLAHFYPLECGETENRARQTLAGLG